MDQYEGLCLSHQSRELEKVREGNFLRSTMLSESIDGTNDDC